MVTQYVTAIEIGTSTTRVVTCSFSNGKQKIISASQCENTALKHGFILNLNEVMKSVKKVLLETKKILGSEVKEVFLVINNISQESFTQDVILNFKEVKEININDINKALEEGERLINLLNKKIIHIIPISFKVDDVEVYRPIGLKGKKLEVKILFILDLEQNLEDLFTIFSANNIDVLEIFSSSLAESSLVLDEKRKTIGCALVNIGAETTSLIVFENNVPILLKVFSFGSLDITNEIALKLKVPLKEAEKIKRGIVFSSSLEKKVNKIIELKLKEFFKIIINFLKKNKKSLLPGGVVITGGGSCFPMIESIAKGVLDLPVEVFTSEKLEITKGLKSPSWFPVVGACLLGQRISTDSSENFLKSKFGKIKNFFKTIFSQLMP